MKDEVRKKGKKKQWNMTKSISFWIFLIGLSVISSIDLSYPVKK